VATDLDLVIAIIEARASQMTVDAQANEEATESALDIYKESKKLREELRKPQSTETEKKVDERTLTEN
jgi:hypothetical protein